MGRTHGNPGYQVSGLIQRRGFLGRLLVSIAALLGGASLLSACGSTDDDSSAGTGDGVCDSAGADAAISGNHGHSLTVSLADITAAVDKTYPSIVTVGHDHAVTITASEFAQLAAGNTISVSTISGPHPHTLTISC